MMAADGGKQIKIMTETTQLSAIRVCVCVLYDDSINTLDMIHGANESIRRKHTHTHTSAGTNDLFCFREESSDEFIIEASHIHICVGMAHMARPPLTARDLHIRMCAYSILSVGIL